MPVIWQSSLEPLYVRTVWVHGIRHAILSRDDPYFKRIKSKQWRPYSSKTYKTTTPRNSPVSHGYNRRANINFMITNAKAQSSSYENSEIESEIEKLDLSEIDNASEEEFILQTKSVRFNNNEPFSYKVNNLILDMKSLKSNKTIRVDPYENTDLSDRVMQWLDLAGKVDLLKQATDNRLAHPRHSWPEIQKRNVLAKSKTAVEFKSKIDSTKEIYHSRVQDIDRSDYNVPLPSNTIENYARQSRHVRITTRNDTNKPKDPSKIKSKQTHVNLQETRNKYTIERKAVEKQYADLVTKKILPECKAKKQVHIFMPAVPKKAGSNISSLSPSLISKAS